MTRGLKIPFEKGGADQSAFDVMHGEHFVIDGHGRIRGYFETDPPAWRAESRHRFAPRRERLLTHSLPDVLPSINATLNASPRCGSCSVTAPSSERTSPLHRFACGATSWTSTVFPRLLFDASLLDGDAPYPGGGWARTLYLGILWTQPILAVVTVPLVLRSLFLARSGRYAEHRKIAKYSLP